MEKTLGSNHSGGFYTLGWTWPALGGGVGFVGQSAVEVLTNKYVNKQDWGSAFVNAFTDSKSLTRIGANTVGGATAGFLTSGGSAVAQTMNVNAKIAQIMIAAGSNATGAALTKTINNVAENAFAGRPGTSDMFNNVDNAAVIGGISGALGGMVFKANPLSTNHFKVNGLPFSNMSRLTPLAPLSSQSQSSMMGQTISTVGNNMFTETANNILNFGYKKSLSSPR